MTTDEIVHRRSDGWPICPVCDEDELWSPLHWIERPYADQDPPSVSQFEAAGLTCYRCGWHREPEAT